MFVSGFWISTGEWPMRPHECGGGGILSCWTLEDESCQHEPKAQKNAALSNSEPIAFPETGPMHHCQKSFALITKSIRKYNVNVMFTCRAYSWCQACSNYQQMAAILSAESRCGKLDIAWPFEKAWLGLCSSFGWSLPYTVCHGLFLLKSYRFCQSGWTERGGREGGTR